MKNKIIKKLLLAAAFTFTALSPLGTAKAQDEITSAELDAKLDELARVENAKVPTVDADPALWVVKDADTTIYLFGTVHVLKPGLEWFDEGVKEAFDKSDVLVMELPDGADQEAAALFGKIGVDQSGKSLRSKLSDADRKIYEAALQQLGLPEASLDPFDPWAAAVTMQFLSLQKAGYQPGSGAESILTSAAKQAKKPIEGLETAEYQLGVFDNLPEESQIRFLIEGARDMDAGTKALAGLIAAWAAGNPEKLAQMMNAGLTDPKLFEALLTQRNANWASWINKRMDKPGTVFIAVGAGHLSGSTSVPQMITAYGLQAERVNY